MSQTIEPTENHKATPAEVSPPTEIKIPSRPHMDEPTIAFLQQRMEKSKCYLEYGSGGSTRMAVKLQIPFVFSVESDLAYGKEVRRVISHQRKSVQFRMSAPNLGPTGRWGYPETREKSGAWWRYPTEIWTMIRKENVTPDLILIDGRFRAACFFASLLQAEPGTVIVLDDYIGREARYPGIAAALPIREMVGRAAIFEVPTQIDHRSAAFELARCCADPN